MKESTRTGYQILHPLGQAEPGTKIEDVFRVTGITEAKLYNLKSAADRV